MENRRRHQRFRAAIAAELELDAELFTGVTRDLSQTGTSLFVDAPLVENSQVQLTLLLTEDGIASADSDPLTLLSEVVWVGERKLSGLLAGLRFVKPTADDVERLAALLAAFSPDLPR
jgi:hypothetical protein